jgi:fatty-acyl-CoA synthase
MPFRLGAFQAAVDRQRPVVPMALTGTRTAWPDETWLLRPAPLVVTIGDPLEPSGTGWAETVRLRDAARAWIAATSGEPVVDRAMVMLDAPPAGPGSQP